MGEAHIPNFLNIKISYHLELAVRGIHRDEDRVRAEL